jgi:hypothetical protein
VAPFVLLVITAASASSRFPDSDALHTCTPSSDDDERCQELDRITSLETGVQSLVRLPCVDCSWIQGAAERDWEDEDEEDRRASNIGTDLLYNISLSNSRSALLLNGVQIFPPPASPPAHPPPIRAPQTRRTYTVADLKAAQKCIQDSCSDKTPGCVSCLVQERGTLVLLSYEYNLERVERDADPVNPHRIWDVRFDALGGSNGTEDAVVVEFSRSKQKVLIVRVKESNPDKQSAAVEKLTIMGVKLRYRREDWGQTLPALSAWQRFRVFLGLHSGDARPNHIIYHQEEWDRFGRIGTLGQWWRSSAEGMMVILVTIAVGALVLCGLYKLLQSARVQQALRGGGYVRLGEDDEDDYEIGEVRGSGRNKPLPPKPLPDKPLPEVPEEEDIDFLIP